MLWYLCTFLQYFDLYNINSTNAIDHVNQLPHNETNIDKSGSSRSASVAKTGSSITLNQHQAQTSDTSKSANKDKAFKIKVWFSLCHDVWYDC
jgi:hypothetical protein